MEMRSRVWLGRAACLLMLAGVFQPFYFRFFSPRARTSFGRFALALPFTKTPSLPRFIDDVRASTRSGDRIALAAPYTKWDGGYAYVFTRSTYLLADRTTIPLVDANDHATPANVASAEYIAAWHTEVSAPGFGQVWRSPDGMLLRKAR